MLRGVEALEVSFPVLHLVVRLVKICRGCSGCMPRD